MTRELLLHIGSHKTGTTTIQFGMHNHRAALTQQGIEYLPADRPPLLHRFIGPAPSGNIALDGFCITNSSGLNELFATSSAERVIASSENFSFFFDINRIEELRKILLRHFDKIRILVYLRRQDTHVVSHHQEGSKSDRLAEEQIFGLSTGAIPWDSQHLDQYLDYNKRIGKWIDVFGRENIVIRIFDRNKLKNGDVWADFLETASIVTDDIKDVREENISHGLTKTKIGHLMNKYHFDIEVHDFILQSLPDDARQLPSRDAAEKFYARYAESNRLLANRIGLGSDLFDLDFTNYSQTANEKWTNEEAENAISALLKAFHNLYANFDANRLRDAALSASNDDRRQLAINLAESAIKLRPSGPIIQQLLRELKS